MVDIIKIIDRYYKDADLRQLLLTHSRLVAAKALECARRRAPHADMQFIREAAMLHDIGIVRCNAPSIFCRGDLPYICHGVAGREILEAESLPRHALVCERHTGSGISKEEIISRQLPLPRRDMLPLSLEEKLICYADKFFSKSGDPHWQKDVEMVMNEMARFGRDSLDRFIRLHQQFG